MYGYEEGRDSECCRLEDNLIIQVLCHDNVNHDNLILTILTKKLFSEQAVFVEKL